MSEPDSIIERLRKAAERAQHASAPDTPPQAAKAEPRMTQKSDEEVVQDAYDAAMKGTFTQNVRDTIEVGGKIARTIKGAFNVAADTWHWVSNRKILGFIPRAGAKFYRFASTEKMPDGTRKFSGRRSFFAVAFLGAAAWWGGTATLGLAKDFAVGTGEFMFDLVAVNTMSGTETIYVNSTKSIEKGVYEIGGCDTYPCSSNDSYSLRIRDSYYLDALQIIGLKNLGFFPDQVVHAVPAAGGICKIDYWGIRARFIRRNTNMFSYVREMTCVPATYENANLHLGEHPQLPIFTPGPK